jgi:lipoprotein-anchoring transpeptidase ErfK/SrfK
MTDYYPVLLRTVTAPGAGDAQWRRGIYDHARQVVVKEMRARQPPARMADVAAEQAALEAAIEKIEADMLLLHGAAHPSPPVAPRPPPLSVNATTRGESAGDRSDGLAGAFAIDPQEEPIAPPYRLISPSLFALPVIVIVLGLGAYAYWAMSQSASAPPGPIAKAPAANGATVAASSAKPAAAKDGDLAPGIDGGSSDADLSYVFRRQPTFYRTLEPTGTIIVDKLQHFLYLTQANSVALRYGIGLGDQCKDLVGLRKISSKAEWPQWQPPPEMVKRTVADASPLPGGPGNPLGARVLELDDGNSRIHGTNAPKTIGNSVTFGCIRLVNDDIVDLYNRVQVSTPVVVN